MKKLIFILCLLLFTVSAAYADRIAPTSDIGLFVDPDLFFDALKKTPIYDHIQGIGFQAYPYASDLITYIEDYKLEDDTLIRCWLDNNGKIHAFKIIISPWYLLRDDCYEAHQLTGFVLLAAGLLISDDDLDAIESIKNNEEYYLARNFYLERYVDDINLNIEISSIYHSGVGLTPYNMMTDLFSDRVCDDNYIGACIPVVSYDMDCSDITVRNFFVVGTDKHRFDGDNNGVCCEPFPN